MIDLKVNFKEYLKDIAIVTPTYTSALANGTIPAPSLSSVTVEGSLQRRSNTVARFGNGQFRADISVIYIDAMDMPSQPSYYQYSGATFVMTEMPIDIAVLSDYYKVNTYTPTYMSSSWTFNNVGSASGGSWSPGTTTSVTATYMFWDPKETAEDFTRSFISNFDYNADMLFAITHPSSPVPPTGSVTTISGNSVKIMHRSEERHKYALGHILVLKRMTT